MGQVEDAIAYAQKQIGKPYVWAAAGPNAFDCSGLIVAAYGHANPPVVLPHWTGALIGMGTEVSRSDLAPGDLVFPDSGHVQLYIGNGQMIEAPHAGATVRQGPLWGFWRGRRIAGDGKSLGSVAATALGVLGELPGPLSAGADVASVLRPFGIAGLHAVDPNFWRRIGMGVVGVWLIVTGLIYLNRRPIASAAGTVGGAIGSVGSTAVQGAAFGFGAGKSGGIPGGVPVSAKPASGPSMRVPKAPPAVAPVTAVPVTTPSAFLTTPNSRYVGKAKAPERKLPGDSATPMKARRPRKTVPKVPGDVAPTVGKPRPRKGLTT